MIKEEQQIVARTYILRKRRLFFVSLIYIPALFPLEIKGEIKEDYPYELMVFECATEEFNYPVYHRDLDVCFSEKYGCKSKTFRDAIHVFNSICALEDAEFFDLIKKYGE